MPLTRAVANAAHCACQAGATHNTHTSVSAGSVSREGCSQAFNAPAPAGSWHSRKVQEEGALRSSLDKVDGRVGELIDEVVMGVRAYRLVV